MLKVRRCSINLSPLFFFIEGNTHFDGYIRESEVIGFQTKNKIAVIVEIKA